MSTHVPGIQSLSMFLYPFVLAKLATSSIRVKVIKQSKHIYTRCEPAYVAPFSLLYQYSIYIASTVLILTKSSWKLDDT